MILAGFGRFGQIVARLLVAQKIPFVALETDAEQVDFVRRFGNVVYYGDPTRPDLLRAAGAAHAKIFIVAIDDVEANLRTAQRGEAAVSGHRQCSRARTTAATRGS